MLTILSEHIEEIISHIESCLPNEGCGIIAGINQKSKIIYPIKNLLYSPTAFQMDPQQQVNAMLKLHSEGQDLLAIFHSHPKTPSVPSITDIENQHYPHTAQIIFSKNNPQWEYKGFIIKNRLVQEIQIKNV